MRRYNIICGIFLILSIIDLALAAPVRVQENRQAFVDVVDMPRDVITVLGKRGDEDVEKLLEEDYKKFEKPPSPDPVSPTANPNPLMEAGSPLSVTSWDSDKMDAPM